MGRMKIKLIIGFVLMITLVVFAIQNAEQVSVHFIFWHIDISRALLILVSVGTGALIHSLFSFSSSWKRRR